MSPRGRSGAFGKRLLAASPFVAVAGLGALIVHQVAYVLAATAGQLHVTADHGHLTTQWAVLTPLAVMSSATLVLRQIRNLGYRSSGPAPLSLAIGSMFAIQEAVEGAASGSMASGLVTVPVLVGLLLTPFVAFCIVRVLADVADVVSRFVAAPRTVSVPTAMFARPTGRACHSQVVLAVAPSRGPPGSMR